MSKLEKGFKLLAEIFDPLVPAFIVAGICQAMALLALQLNPALETQSALHFIYSLLLLISASFTPFMSAWIGYLTSKALGGTAIIGGMIGMMTMLPRVDEISSILGLEAVLQSGSGGVIAAFIGAALAVKFEKGLNKIIPKSLEAVIIPLLTVICVSVPYLLVIMPLSGFVAQGLCLFIEAISSGDALIVKLLSGFIAAAIFLPINAAGLQHGIIALYPIELEKYGYISLYPVFAMAGAGQVGSALAVALRAKAQHNDKLSQVAFSASLPGILGVATPLLYGVSLRIPKAFLAACLGSGVGGAFIMAMGIVSTGWGPSGILAIPMMAGGSVSILMSMLLYCLGLLVSATSGFILALLLVRPLDVAA